MLPFLETKATDLFVYSFADFSFPPHFHNSMEIICAEKGEIALVLDEERRIIRGGELAVVFPGRIHSYEAVADKSNSGFVMLLGGGLITEYKNELKNNALESPVFSIADLDGDCRRAIAALKNLSGGDFREQKAYSLLFLCRFLPSAHLVPVRPANENALYPLVKYMEQHFREDICLDDAASALYMSRYRLSGIFSHELNTSFNDYLNGLRTNLAIQLMDTTESSITSIAFEVGFTNVRTFNRAFKKQYAVSPSEYRKKRRGEV